MPGPVHGRTQSGICAFLRDPYDRRPGGGVDGNQAAQDDGLDAILEALGVDPAKFKSALQEAINNPDSDGSLDLSKPFASKSDPADVSGPSASDTGPSPIPAGFRPIPGVRGQFTDAAARTWCSGEASSMSTIVSSSFQ